MTEASLRRMAPQAPTVWTRSSPLPVEISTGRADEGLAFRLKMIEAALEAPTEQLVIQGRVDGCYVSAVPPASPLMDS